VVDRALLAHKIALIRDAVARVREVLPPRVEDFQSDRTAREVVALNLFVALQEAAALASHWLADAGWPVPAAYRDLFASLASHGLLTEELGRRLASATGLRNLLAHQYGALDWTRVHAIAASELDDLLSFCRTLADKAEV
jgi:uncharacterized protein YutE (UPF0331/DUF86 family)